VFFRAADLATAQQIIQGLTGAHGAAIPEGVASRLGGLGGLLQALGVTTFLGGGAVFIGTWVWVAVAVVLAFGFPNTQEIMRHFEPALPEEGRASARSHWLSWRPRGRDAVIVGVLFGLGILALSRPTEFLYFQF
jgi:alginate O-acetyltransferase complex protein AlgI